MWAAIDPVDLPMTHADALAAAARHMPPLPGDRAIVKTKPRHDATRRPGTHVIARTPRYDDSNTMIDMIPTGTQVEVNLAPARMIADHECVLVRPLGSRAAAWVRSDLVAA